MQRQGIKLVRDLGAALGPLLGMEQSPGAGVVTDEDIEGWLRNGSANSQFHYACSCGMLPRAQGGCVDSKLRVYGAGELTMMDYD
jgi:choline dehydrogenase